MMGVNKTFVILCLCWFADFSYIHRGKSKKKKTTCAHDYNGCIGLALRAEGNVTGGFISAACRQYTFDFLGTFINLLLLMNRYLSAHYYSAAVPYRHVSFWEPLVTYDCGVFTNWCVREGDRWLLFVHHVVHVTRMRGPHYQHIHISFVFYFFGFLASSIYEHVGTRTWLSLLLRSLRTQNDITKEKPGASTRWIHPTVCQAHDTQFVLLLFFWLSIFLITLFFFWFASVPNVR